MRIPVDSSPRKIHRTSRKSRRAWLPRAGRRLCVGLVTIAVHTRFGRWLFAAAAGARTLQHPRPVQCAGVPSQHCAPTGCGAGAAGCWRSGVGAAGRRDGGGGAGVAGRGGGGRASSVAGEPSDDGRVASIHHHTVHVDGCLQAGVTCGPRARRAADVGRSPARGGGGLALLPTRPPSARASENTGRFLESLGPAPAGGGARRLDRSTWASPAVTGLDGRGLGELRCRRPGPEPASKVTFRKVGAEGNERRPARCVAVCSASWGNMIIYSPMQTTRSSRSRRMLPLRSRRSESARPIGRT